MLKIHLEIDVAAFERQVDDHMLKAFAPAVVEGLNRTGEAGADAIRRGMMTAFDRPTPFTLEGVGVLKASIRTDGGDPSVLIFIWDRAASYLDLHVEDGARRTGDPFATRPHPIVPGPQAPGDIPSSNIRRIPPSPPFTTTHHNSLF